MIYVIAGCPNMGNLNQSHLRNLIERAKDAARRFIDFLNQQGNPL